MARLKVKVDPGAGRNRIIGWRDDILKVKIKAPPEKGRANMALIKFLAMKLRVERRAIEICHGLTGSIKLVEVNSLNERQIRERL